jgi:hypothetical protein
MKITHTLRRGAENEKHEEWKRLRKQAEFDKGREYTTGPANELALTENRREKVADRILAATEPEKFRQAETAIKELSDYRKGPYGTVEKKKETLKV